MDIQFFIYIAISVFGGFFYGELIGYILHRIIHSGRVRYLSKSHMIHHLKLYGPKMPQLHEKYKISVKNRIKVAGLGMEWFVPLFIALSSTIIIGLLLSILFLFVAIFLSMAVLWGIFMFGYMHNALHVKGFWMTKNRVLKDWFLKVRDLHVVHHVNLDNIGRMNKNFGICFFLFDKLFWTFQSKNKPFNEMGFHEAQKTYDYIYKSHL